MANITPRKNKDGEIISYQIRVFRGRNADGTRLKDYMMTWRPTPGMTKRQITKELERQATLFEEACKQGQVSIEKPTFEKYAAYVVELKERNGLKVKTAVRYKDMLKRINAEIGPIKLQDLRPDHLNRLYAKLAEPGQNKKTGGGLSAKTIVEHHRVISTILAQAVKEQLIPFNTAERATPPKLQKHEMDAFEVEEVQAILKALETEPLKWQICVQLLIATGARRGEIMGLRWGECRLGGKQAVSLREPCLHAGERRNQHHAKDRGKPLCFRFTFCYGPSETLEGGAGSHIPKTGDHSLRLCSDGGERRADAPGQPHRLAL